MDAIPSFWRGQVDVLKDKPWCGQGEVTDSHEPEVRAGISFPSDRSRNCTLVTR